MSGEKTPPDDHVVASASRTGSAEAQTGGTANSGTVINSALTSQVISHQSNRWYSVFARQEQRASSRGGLAAVVLLVTVVVLYMRPAGPESQFVIPYVFLATANIVSLLLAVDAWAQTGGPRSVRSRPRHTGKMPASARLVMSSLCLTLTAFAVLQTDHIRKYGRVDVSADRISISKSEQLKDGERTVLTVRPHAQRRYLELKVTISSSSKSIGVCAYGTTFSLAMGEQRPEKKHMALRSGEPVELNLRGRGEIKLRLAVATETDCEVDIDEAQVAVYG